MQRISDKERQYVLDVLDGQFRTSAGNTMTQRFERLFAEKFGVRYAISHVNGTATLHTALVAAGVKPGDEVIVPPLTMSSTSFAVIQAGAVPVFADVDPHTFNIDPVSVASRITEKTRAIMPVALFGLSPDLDPLMELAKKHNLAVVEDDAQCFGGYYKGRVVGSIGHLSSFSFQSSKHLTSGEGGIILTDDEELADKARRFNSLGYAAVGAQKGKITRETIQDPNYLRHASVGWNYRMPELCSAVCLAQTERMEELVAVRVNAAQRLAEAVDGCSWLHPQVNPEGYVNAYWSYVLRLDDAVDFSWHDFRNKFCELGGDGVYAAWQLTYLEPAFRGKDLSVPGVSQQTQVHEAGLCPVAESIQPRLLQFKTNYFEEERAVQQAEILRQTIEHFGRAGASRSGSVSAQA